MMSSQWNRREFLKALAAVGAGAVLAPVLPWLKIAESADPEPGVGPRLRKPIPVTGETIPVIGMGTWLTFDVGDNPESRDARTQVLKEFFRLGGGMIDSSPMYGSSREVLGYGLQKLGPRENLFSAGKVWTSFASRGRAQIRESLDLWGIPRFDLCQIHNLLNWVPHLETLTAMKDEGIVRYIGMTTSHGRRHAEVENILLTQPIDFIQLTYNIQDREVEERLLPLARERGIAVIANRPFQGGGLIDRLQRNPLPEWAAEFDCANWAQFLLKFIVSHPAVTCAIPATTRVEHMRENMGASYGRLPDAPAREKMIRFVADLS